VLSAERPRNPFTSCSRAVSVLQAHGHCVTASDLMSDGIDFLTEHRAPEGVGALVTNPLYKLAAEFARHGLKAIVVMLLRLNFLEGIGRSDLVEGGQLALHVFANRLPRMHLVGWTGPRCSSTTAYAWSCVQACVLIW
jgi:hypothetical protein